MISEKWSGKELRGNFGELSGGPAVNTPQSTNYTATCLSSRKLSKLDESDMQDTAGEPETSS